MRVLTLAVAFLAIGTSNGTAQVQKWPESKEDVVVKQDIV